MISGIRDDTIQNQNRTLLQHVSSVRHTQTFHPHFHGRALLDICITFVQCWINVEDVAPTLYKCYTTILWSLGWEHFWTGQHYAQRSIHYQIIMVINLTYIIFVDKKTFLSRISIFTLRIFQFNWFLNNPADDVDNFKFIGKLCSLVRAPHSFNNFMCMW